jgi:hypothetical protein
MHNSHALIIISLLLVPNSSNQGGQFAGFIMHKLQASAKSLHSPATHTIICCIRPLGLPFGQICILAVCWGCALSTPTCWLSRFLSYTKPAIIVKAANRTCIQRRTAKNLHHSAGVAGISDGGDVRMKMICYSVQKIRFWSFLMCADAACSKA